MVWGLVASESPCRQMLPRECSLSYHPSSSFHFEWRFVPSSYSSLFSAALPAVIATGPRCSVLRPRHPTPSNFVWLSVCSSRMAAQRHLLRAVHTDTFAQTNTKTSCTKDVKFDGITTGLSVLCEFSSFPRLSLPSSFTCSLSSCSVSLAHVCVLPFHFCPIRLQLPFNCHAEFNHDASFDSVVFSIAAVPLTKIAVFRTCFCYFGSTYLTLAQAPLRKTALHLVILHHSLLVQHFYSQSFFLDHRASAHWSASWVQSLLTFQPCTAHYPVPPLLWLASTFVFEELAPNYCALTVHFMCLNDRDCESCYSTRYREPYRSWYPACFLSTLCTYILADFLQASPNPTLLADPKRGRRSHLGSCWRLEEVTVALREVPDTSILKQCTLSMLPHSPVVHFSSLLGCFRISSRTSEHLASCWTMASVLRLETIRGPQPPYTL